MTRLLVIGGGSIGERHVRCFLRTGRAQVSLCEVSKPVRDRLNAGYDIDAVFEDFDAALTHSFDAAVICTPAQLHVPMALTLAGRGVHLLIEKPLSVSFDGIDQLKRLRDQSDLVVDVAYVLRHHPVLAAMKAHLEAGVHGQPVQVVAQSGQHFPVYRPTYRETYYTRHETGGGAIQDALTHAINAVEWLVGPTTRLVVDAEHCVLEGVDVEDTVHVLTRHGSIAGSFSLNQHQPVMESHITVNCERGALRGDLVANRLLTASEQGGTWTTESDFSMERDDLFVAQANAFLDQVRNNRETGGSLEDAMQTLSVNLAALKSNRIRQWVNVTDD